uniref:Uncharacterized protein n=1 Tax=Florenciella sp. virus SA2 TaxID=3240092 RepID=A0AB39JE59_9VIRU
MTTSIAFEGFTNEEIENFDFITFNENYTNNIENVENEENQNLDPSGALYGLQRLRYLKTNETGEQIVIPDINGRETGNNVVFYTGTNGDGYTYEQYKHRRKAEVLKYKNSNKNKKSNYSNISKNVQLSSAAIKNLCNDDNTRIIYKPGTNSGIKSSTDLLYLNNNVPFYSSL